MWEKIKKLLAYYGPYKFLLFSDLFFAVVGNIQAEFYEIIIIIIVHKISPYIFYDICPITTIIYYIPYDILYDTFYY